MSAREPRIVAFLCEACAYAAADDAGRARYVHPQAPLTLRVACAGRVEPGLVVQALREGADGVLVGGCHPGDCRFVDGNLRAASRMTLLTRALEQAGVEPARVRVEWIGANEGERFARIVTEMVEELRALPTVPPRAPQRLPARLPSGGGEGRKEEGAGGGERSAAGTRPRIAFYWNASCGGCEEAVIDLGEALPRLMAQAEVVLWPAAIDAKRAEIEALPDGAIDVAFVNGAVRLDEQADWARLLRRKSRRVVAFGACAQLGGIVGLGDLDGPEAILDAAYGPDVPSVSNPGAPGPSPGDSLPLPALLPRTLPLDRVVPVDAVVPGCPPSTPIVERALAALLSDAPPGGGAVLAPDASLCETCPLRESRPERPALHALRRLATEAPEPGRCFLAQGIACSGPATRQGCQPGCVEAGMPCRGCFGPVSGAGDLGAAMVGAFGSLTTGDGPERTRLAAALPDPAGTFWRYGWAAGMPARPRRGGR
ncbi:MAG TPA: hydrogenase iron-sulfur subunit [Anaeromyxobacteraceae bacterium]|nr:hydrogenase iron-sulfur subunit [Anaeromyxobacteraceae bacterium]